MQQDEAWGTPGRADYQVGQTIRYLDDGSIRTGEIEAITREENGQGWLWVNGINCIRPAQVLQVVEQQTGK